MLLSLATTGGGSGSDREGETTGTGNLLPWGEEEGGEKTVVVARWRRPSHNAKINSGLKTLVQVFIMAGTHLFLCVSKLSLGFRAF